MDYQTAKELLLRYASCPDSEMADIGQVYGRILGEDIVAHENVPGFARSPYDGYAFCAVDTVDCGDGRNVTLKVIDRLRAGEVSKKRVVSGTAVRLMTGAMLPDGADAICKYEDTDFTKDSVTLKHQYRSGENVVAAGEDIQTGRILAEKGSRVDPGLNGALASLGIASCRVMKKLRVGILSTGDEVIPVGEALSPGKIRNSNRYTISAALMRQGMETVYIGHAKDDRQSLIRMIEAGETMCDVIVSTGGVSVGDYDLVPEAMAGCGYEILVRGVAIKPGMACAYGIKNGRMMLALSGNPASSLTNLECVCMPALKKMAGFREYDHHMIRMRLKRDIRKGAKGIRFIRGKLVYEEGQLVLDAAFEQGNIVISSAIGANAYGVLRDVLGPVSAGTMIDGFIL